MNPFKIEEDRPNFTKIDKLSLMGGSLTTMDIKRAHKYIIHNRKIKKNQRYVKRRTKTGRIKYFKVQPFTVLKSVSKRKYKKRKKRKRKRKR